METTANALSYFPGCSGHGTGLEYDVSARKVCHALGLTLVELSDWNCCGATSAHALSGELAVALGVRNLVLAEAAGLPQLVTPCAACFNRLRQAAVHAEAQGTPMGLPEVQGRTEVLHLLDVLARPDQLKTLAAQRHQSLQRLRVVTYYGCLTVRPPDVTGAQNPENPTSMDRLLAAMEVEVRPWPYKTRCCGTSLAMTRTDIVEKLTGELMTMAQRAGAEAVVTACPLCFVNLDTRQQSQTRLPIFYFTELMALFMGLPGARATLRRHNLSPLPLLKSKGIAQ